MVRAGGVPGGARKGVRRVRERLAVHRAVMVVDVEGFGDPARTNLDQLAVRDALYRSLSLAFAQSGIGWDSCVSEDRGDGALILIPPEIPKALLVTGLPDLLAAAVGRHNAECAGPQRMRLRMALHAGEVHHDAHGVAGASVNHAFRLAEAAELRSALAASPGVLAVIVSDWFYTEVVRHDPAAGPGSYRQVQVSVKETAAAGWIRVPDPGAAPARDGQSDDEGGQGRAAITVPGNRGLVGHDRASGTAAGLSGSSQVIADGRLIPAQLPHDVLGFTGRQPELAGLADLAADQEGAAVVITAIDGVAGIGKTALAVHFAHRAAHAFPDGQLFVNLRGFDPEHPPLDPADVLARFVRALGAGAQLAADPDELAGMYRSLLSGRRVLVVLDNAAGAGQVRPLLPGSPGCLAIVTSRNRLSSLTAVDGAQRVTLDMLPPGDAAALIARAAGADRAAADPDAAHRLAELCGRLPLALRITADRAAAHPHLSLAYLADELAAERDRLDVLAADEQISQVRTVFSWSYRALTPAVARAFRLLGLHPGQDISTAAAGALLDVPVLEARQLLNALTGGHLLEETGQDRYQFHDLVRVYAAECAQTSEPEALRAAAVHRLLTWYLHTADAFRRIFNPDNRHVRLDPPPPSCMPPNFTTHLQAWHWAESEFANLVPVLRKAPSAGDDVLTWKYPVTAMLIFDLFGHWADIVPGLRSALSITRRLGDHAAESWVLAGLAESCLYSDTPEAAIEYCRAVLAISAETGDWKSQWEALHLEGNAHLALGRLGEARDRLQQALATARRACDIRAEGMSLTWLGAVHERLGSFDTAISLRQQAVAALKQARNRWQYAFALHQLAKTCHHHGHIADAIGNYQLARAIFGQIGDRRTEADILIDLGHAQESTGQADAARQSWQQALAILEEIRDPRADQIRTQLAAKVSEKTGHAQIVQRTCSANGCLPSHNLPTVKQRDRSMLGMCSLNAGWLPAVRDLQ
jgi:tetratricopeptide (TPR) repeat protein